MKKTISVLFASFLFISAIAQSQDEAGVRECLQNYMSGQGEKVEKAFHPSATMKYIDAQSKEFKDVPIADYISRVKANNSSGNRNDRKIEIVSLNVEGSAAQAKIKIETEKNILYDYMNLLKINGEWKIVSKIFSRLDK